MLQLQKKLPRAYCSCNDQCCERLMHYRSLTKSSNTSTSLLYNQITPQTCCRYHARHSNQLGFGKRVVEIRVKADQFGIGMQPAHHGVNLGFLVAVGVH